MVQPLGYLKETASQTAGPYVHIGLLPRQAGFDVFANNLGGAMLGPKTGGERVSIEGRVIDGSGALVKDALIEIWQANAASRKRSTMIFAAGDARAAISRVAATASAPSSQVPSSAAAVIGPWHRTSILWIVARGINIGLSTRMYFADEEEANAADPVLNIIEPASRRKTLVGQRQVRDQDVVYNFDIYLQGERETVFFDI